MEVKVIGCSTTWTERPTSSYCLDENTLIDCGEGTLKFYKNAKVELNNIKNIFITHLHSDHTGALMNLLYHLRWKTINNVQTSNLNIYGPKGIKKHIKKMMKLFMYDCKPYTFMKYVNICEITNFEKTYKVDDYEIECFDLVHGKIKDIAYTFKKDNKTVGFSGDCTHTKNLDKFVQSANFLFLECCGKTTNKAHIGVDTFLQYKQANKNKTFLAIHVCDEIYSNENSEIQVAKYGQKYEI